ncbi:MAG: ABC transporter permease, partial [Gemmatimonadota bacterium]|nr:ABC transporter permease [Gemmatimonadota bacterium]
MSSVARRFAIAAYRLLLRLLPADLRRAHGDDITALLADELDRARAQGGLASMMTWLAAAWDVMRRAPHEHWRRLHVRTHQEGRMRSFWTDLRFAMRSFARQKGSTAVILVTLTLAVAANTAVFTLLDGLFLRPFPFSEPNRLAYLNEKAPKWNLEYTGINYADFYIWRKNTHAFDSMALMDEQSVNLSQGGTADRVDGARVTYDLPAVLQLRPVLGRFFSADEDRPKAPDVVVIGYGMWRSRFAGARDVVGRTMRINSKPYTIIGVMPSEGEFPGNVQLWLPMAEDPNLPYQSYSYEGIGRLKPGVTIEQARQDIIAAHRAVYAAQHDTSHVVSPTMMFLRDRYVADFKTIGTALGAGGLLVLLIACANVAGAMLARAIFRQREIGIRMALGANASRLTRQLLTESLALAAMAGAAGTLLGWWGLRTLLASVPDQLPKWVHVSTDLRVVVFSIAIVAVTAVLFGLIPALEVRRQDVSNVIGTNGQRTTSSVPQRRVLDSLVVVEIALAAVLLAGGALLVRAFSNLKDVDPGFRVDNVATFRISLPHASYPDGNKQRLFYQTVLDKLAAIPGVTDAGAITCPPLSCHWGQFYAAEGGAPPGPNGTDPVVLTRIASPGYFSA